MTTQCNNIEIWRLFCLAVRTGSLKAAAQVENTDTYTLSRAVQSLEKALGEPLYDRSFRPAQLTQFGRRAYREMSPVVAAYSRAATRLRFHADRLEGPITVATHAAFGATFLPEMLMAFQAEYADIETEWVELTQEKQQALLTTGETAVDIAQCYGPLPEPIAAEVIPLGNMHFVACCSPLYAARCGIPDAPKDCTRHTGLLLQSEARTSVTELVHGSDRRPVPWQRTMRFQNLISALQSARLGAGILPDLPRIYLRDPQQTKTLIPVMPRWERPPLPCYLIINPQSAGLARIQLFAQWLAPKCRQLLQTA